MVQKFEERPPFVRFEVRAEEDRQASIEAGHYVGTDVDYALITPMGSKDCIERKVDEWFLKLRKDVEDQRCPREWFSMFKESYKEWKEGREVPVNGSPILNWPPASPSQIKTLLSLHVRTVEDLAGANEEVLGRLGMGGRALKQKAADWLASAANTGKVSEASAALKVENAQLQERCKLLEERVAQLAQQIQEAPAGKKP